MPSHEIVRVSTYSAKQMFDMVADVAAYQDFLPLVRESTVFELEQKDDGSIIFKGKLTVKKENLKISETFTSTVVTDETNFTIVSTSNTGPVKRLSNRWKFVDLPDGGSKSQMVLDYEITSLPLRLLMRASYDFAMGKLVDAFEKRADKLYG